MTTEEWVAAYAAAAGTSPPSPDDIEILLQLAAVAAHASERTAAPITCWIAATAGLAPARALALAESMALGAS
jgi:C4-dicarboxylate transporter